MSPILAPPPTPVLPLSSPNLYPRSSSSSPTRCRKECLPRGDAGEQAGAGELSPRKSHLPFLDWRTLPHLASVSSRPIRGALFTQRWLSRWVRFKSLAGHVSHEIPCTMSPTPIGRAYHVVRGASHRNPLHLTSTLPPCPHNLPTQSEQARTTVSHFEDNNEVAHVAPGHMGPHVRWTLFAQNQNFNTPSIWWSLKIVVPMCSQYNIVPNASQLKSNNTTFKSKLSPGGCIKGIWKGCVPHTKQLFPRVSDSNRLRLCRIQIRVSNNTGTVEIGLADRKAFLGFLSSKLQVVFANRETNGLGTKSGTSCCLLIQCSLLYTFAWIPCPFLEESKENLCWPMEKNAK